MNFREWLKIESADLSYLLGPVGTLPHIGPEKGTEVQNGIAKFASPHGSVRYVYYVNSTPVSALQVVRKGRNASIANVFTHPDYRRKQFATQLLRRAEQDFRITHSPHRTDDGNRWIASLG